MAALRKLMPLFSASLALVVAHPVNAQLAADQIVTRTFKLQRALTAADLHHRFADAGINFPTDPILSPTPPFSNAMFLNERTLMLTVRATLAEMDKVEAVVSRHLAPPIVLIESNFIELSSGNAVTPLKPHPQSFTNVTVYTERQSRAAMEKFRGANGVNLIITPPIMTISGRQARLRMEETRTLQYDTPPRLPRDTRPDADPTPYNQGRLPFPPTFARR